MLNHNLRGRGTWHRAWQLARTLGRRGHAVTLWTAAPHHWYRSARETIFVRDIAYKKSPHRITNRTAGLTVIETPSWAPLAGADDGWGPLDVAWRAGHILLQPFDLCYAFAHPPNVFIPAWLAHRLRGRPLIYDWCDWYEGGIFPKRRAMRHEGLIPPGEPPLQERTERWELALERRMLRLADRVTVISNRLLELALAAGRRREDLLLLPNGADLDGIRPRPAADCRAALGLTDGAFYLGYVANYHPDQELLLRAFARALRSVPDLKLLKTGPPFATELVRTLQLESHIIDYGYVPFERIPLILGAADVLALPLEDNPSNVARVPFKFTDYLAAGRPVVTCAVGDLAGLFSEQAPIGLAADPTPEAYGDAIARIFALGLDLADMGAAARRLAEREFAWPALTDKLEEFMKIF